MSNAKNLVRGACFLIGAAWEIPLDKAVFINCVTTKQVSNDLFCQFQTCVLFACSGGLVHWMCPVLRYSGYQTFMESLILAQDERWRRA